MSVLHALAYTHRKPNLYNLIYNEVLRVLVLHEADGNIGRFFLAASIANRLEDKIKNYIKENNNE